MKKSLLTALLPFVVNCAFSQLPLPYHENFSGMTTKYPPGWQGVLLDEANTSVFDTTSIFTPVPIREGSNTTTAGGIYNFSNSLGWLNTATNNYAVMVTITTKSSENIAVRYLVKTVRKTNKVSESILQYRINKTGSFKNISASSSLPDTIREIILPPDCDNQQLIELRWLSRDYAGTGARPSLSIDDVSIFSTGKDAKKPVVTGLIPFRKSTSQAAVLQLIFDEEVVKGNGNIYFNNDTLNINDPTVTITGKTVTVRRILLPGQRYKITVDSAAIKDRYGNLFSGVGENDNWYVDATLYSYQFTFDDCIENSHWAGAGFHSFNRKGTTTWNCVKPGLEINGFSDLPASNEDWLISPSLDLREFRFPLLQYRIKKEFEGPALSIRISNNYNGTETPGSADWTEISGGNRIQDGWHDVNGINLLPFKDSNIHVALVYTSDKIQQAAKWSVSLVAITDTSAAPPLKLILTPASLDFGYTSTTLTDSVSYSFNGSPIKAHLSATAGFQLSLDGSNYYQELEDSPGFMGKLYIRFQPGLGNKNYEGQLLIRVGQQELSRVLLKGSTVPALKIVNWNICWFGSPVEKPADDSLQAINVLSVLKRLNAEIYGLVEVVDTNRLRSVVKSLPGYDFVVSGTDSLSGIPYSRAQKLAVVYKRDNIKVLQSRSLLQYSSSAYTRYNWSGGRYPFLVRLQANKAEDSCMITLVLVHAKANTGDNAEQQVSWERRRNGVKELKDTLDKYCSDVNLLILGDYNDDLTRTVVGGRADTLSSWADLIRDPVYVPFTWPLSQAGERSTLHYPGVIDHVVGRNGMMVANTGVGIQTWVTDRVAAYGSTTSDHYPVASCYSWRILGDPFPVNGLHASSEDGYINIRWEMPYLVNCADIAVERLENVNKLVAILPGPVGGSSKENITFAVTDTFANIGLNCYRLKITGLDKTIKYSAPVYAFNGLKRNLWSVKGELLHYWVDWSQRESVPVQLIDLHGRIICQGMVFLEKGYNYNTIFIGQQSTGIYFLRIGMAGRLLVLKILVNH